MRNESYEKLNFECYTTVPQVNMICIGTLSPVALFTANKDTCEIYLQNQIIWSCRQHQLRRMTCLSMGYACRVERPFPLTARSPSFDMVLNVLELDCKEVLQTSVELNWNKTELEGAVEADGFSGVDAWSLPASTLGLELSKRFLHKESIKAKTVSNIKFSLIIKYVCH